MVLIWVSFCFSFFLIFYVTFILLFIYVIITLGLKYGSYSVRLHIIAVCNIARDDKY